MSYTTIEDLIKFLNSSDKFVNAYMDDRGEEPRLAVTAKGKKPGAKGMVSSGQEKEFTIVLGGAQLEALYECDDVEIVQRLQESLRQQSEFLAKQEGPLLPIFRSAIFLDHVQTATSLNPVKAGVMKQFSPNLFLGYAYDYGSCISGVYDTELHKMPEGVTLENVHEHATNNLQNMMESKEGGLTLVPLSVSGFYRMELDSAFDASMLLQLGAWQAAAKHFSCELSELYAAIPASDSMLFCQLKQGGADSYSTEEEVLGDLQELIAFMASELESDILSPSLFKWDAERGRPRVILEEQQLLKDD